MVRIFTIFLQVPQTFLIYYVDKLCLAVKSPSVQSMITKDFVWNDI